MTAEELTAIINEWVGAELQKGGHQPVALTDDTDLLSDGVIDSLAFVELLIHLQECIGTEIDLVDADPGEFTTVAGLCRLVLADARE